MRRSILEQPLKLLLVEDNPSDAYLIQEQLLAVPDSAFTVVQARRLEEALQLVGETAFDAVLLDLGLPDCSGLETVQRMSAHAPRLPLLVLTGNDDMDLGLQAMRQGAQDYLLKSELGASSLARAIRYALERKRTEELRQEHQLLETVLALAPVGVVLVDAAGEIGYQSPGALLILGGPVTGTAVGPMPAGYLVRVALEKDGEELPLVRTLRTGEAVYNVELRVTRPDGREIQVLTSTGPLRDAEGRIAGAVAAFIDITDKKRAESALRDHARRLEATNRDLEYFSYTVSHDLRAPLRGVLGFASLLQEAWAEGRQDEAGDFLLHIERNAVRMSQLIDDLLRLSQLGRGEVTLRPVDMSALTNSVWDDLRRTVENRHVELALSSLPSAMGETGLLRQVLTNLLENALKFTGTREKAIIEVGGTVREGMARYHVRDNGVGFNTSYADRLFRAFSRLHSESEFPGTGVGLASVKRIVDRHGGEVWAESSPGEGATFYFTLPASDARENDPSTRG